MHSIVYSKELNLVYARISGATSQSETMLVLGCIIKNPEIPKDVQMITDYKEAIPNQLNTQLIRDTASNVKEFITQRFDHLRWAQVSDTPQHVVGNTIFEHLVNNPQVSFKQFSTLPAALMWIGVDIHALDTIESWLKIEC